MEINRDLLKTMLREFWGLNNELCENATIIFLRKCDLTDKEIESWLDIRQSIKNRDLKEAQEIFDEKVQETKNYFYE
jgi:hypothetical protein